MLFDVIKEVILILDQALNIVDIFECTGLTEQPISDDGLYFTYKKLLIPEGACALCNKTISQLQTPCVSNSGKHAIVGRHLEDIPMLQRASSYHIPLFTLVFDEFGFYLEKDNLFPLDSEHPVPDPDPLDQNNPTDPIPV
jgi:hypothetical protein